MKKLFLIAGLVAAGSLAYGQGTVAFSNNGFYRISTGEAGSASSTWVQATTTPNTYNFGLFYGIGGSSSLTLLTSQLGVNSTANGGVIASSIDGVSALGVVGIPGTVANQSDVWLQVKGWSASFGTDWSAAQTAALTTPGAYFGQTAIVNALPLGAAVTGPGTAIWQLASQTSPNKFAGGFTMFTAVIPEPGTMALTGLGVAAMLIFRRRK